MTDIDCTRTNLSIQEKNYCNCEDAIKRAKKLMDDYEARTLQYQADSSSYQRWSSLWGDWKERRGSFANYINHGVSQDFTVQWGWADSSTNQDCKKCAANDYKWGDGNKWGNGMWCDGHSGSLLGSSGYEDVGAWGWHINGSRKWWTCKKSGSQINSENQTYNQAEPLYDPQATGLRRNWKIEGPPKLPPPPTIGDIVCCSQIFSGIKVVNGDLDLKNINQNCGNTNNNPPPPSEPPKPTTIQSKIENLFDSKSGNKSLLIGGGGLIFLSSCCSIFLSIILLLMKDK